MWAKYMGLMFELHTSNYRSLEATLWLSIFFLLSSPQIQRSRLQIVEELRQFDDFFYFEIWIASGEVSLLASSCGKEEVFFALLGKTAELQST